MQMHQRLQVPWQAALRQSSSQQLVVGPKLCVNPQRRRRRRQQQRRQRRRWRGYLNVCRVARFFSAQAQESNSNGHFKFINLFIFPLARCANCRLALKGVRARAGLPKQNFQDTYAIGPPNHLSAPCYCCPLIPLPLPITAATAARLCPLPPLPIATTTARCYCCRCPSLSVATSAARR